MQWRKVSFRRSDEHAARRQSGHDGTLAIVGRRQSDDNGERRTIKHTHTFVSLWLIGVTKARTSDVACVWIVDDGHQLDSGAVCDAECHTRTGLAALQRIVDGDVGGHAAAVDKYDGRDVVCCVASSPSTARCWRTDNGRSTCARLLLFGRCEFVNGAIEHERFVAQCGALASGESIELTI